ncbi:hypothetical protein BDY24DRAFT_383971 [Mrakia frigida]|uniref:uncharacterized protein n=1 Tax=Mrakia frigida TaxID=29902 RepID=UPI003FCC0CCF
MSEWVQEEQYSPVYEEGGGEGSEGLVYEDPQQLMEYSSMPPGQYGLYPLSPSDQVDYSVQHQQQSNVQPRLQPPIPQLLPAYSTYHDRTNLAVNSSTLGTHPSLGSRSASSSSSCSSYALSPNPSAHDWIDSSSPTIYGGVSPGGGYTSPGFVVDASSKQINHAPAPAFHLPSQAGARTRSYTTSSLSQAFPVQQQQEARPKKISKEEGLKAIDLARRYRAQSGEPDALDVALALTRENPFPMEDDGDLQMGGN